MKKLHFNLCLCNQLSLSDQLSLATMSCYGKTGAPSGYQCSGLDLERDKFCGALRKDAFIRQENLYKHF
ncbi:hypothetical protein [Photobacterium ganghwense]|uniref:hypothetical protein n=1 Tax=Photobacterium ganghwense TaxID=320778 RepID=UPI001A9050CF|nr:hypothetical protein [Photobacterium ganghwense]QSV16787.1 hypothetical protein FH974_17620 [Photobacterium ganghwense]